MAALRLCSIPDCGKPVKSRGWCSMHYERCRVYGDPLAVRPTYSECTIPGCGKRHFGHGWCVRHYQRWRRYGDPLAGRQPNGSALRYFNEVVLAYDGDDCLIWPFARGGTGYGTINKNDLVHCMVCEDANGPRPTPKHEAAHLCGRGNEGCCTKRHLVWKTHAENMADTIIHGTSTRGERSVGSVLTEDDVRRIRQLATQMNMKEVARTLGFGYWAVRNVVSRATWAWLD